MTIQIDSSTLRQTSWRGHVARFAIGGVVTVFTGLIGKAFGPRVGGVFLALPAVFPVSVYMMGRLENQKVGPGARGDRARRAAFVDASGAAMGGAGMVAFAVVAAVGLERNAPVALGAAVLAWALIALCTWGIRRRIKIRRT